MGSNAVANETRCAVCSHVVVHDGVRCASCHAPYHRDCFEYVGHCSRYGCQQARYQAMARLAPAVPFVPGKSRLSMVAHTRLKASARALMTFGAATLGVIFFLFACGFWPILFLLSLLPMSIPILALGSGMLLHLAEGSEWTLEPDSGDVHLMARILGITLFERRVPLSEIQAVDLYEPKGPGHGPMWLTLLTHGGRRLYLTVGDGALIRGYAEADLVRLGVRWSKILSVPFTHSHGHVEIPELPAGD
jgi:hypothetical protein